ncbi:MAG TPA: prolyl oligopeptidase family serine peptidase [Chloroflexia bacterium]|nr:prolyl oligopeptidase family serine peptidase [Chloroflexia bacterium]
MESIRKDSVIDNYHGTEVADPYRWMEDPSLPDTIEWVDAQNKVSSAFLNSYPGRDIIKNRLRELWNYPKYSAPFKKGERYFFYKNDGLQNQAVLYMQTSLDSAPVVVIDPNHFSEDGTVALSTVGFNKNGTLLAYGVSHSGSDWQEIKIRKVDQAKDYPEVIRWCKFSSIAWKEDNSGFYYNRLPQPGTIPPEDESNFSQVYWHTLGTAQEADKLVYERPDFKELTFSPFMTEDDQYLLLDVSYGTDPRNRVYYREVNSDKPFIRLLDEADASYSFVGNQGSLFYFHTDLDAPRGRVIAIDLEQPERENWREIVPEQTDTLSFAGMVNNQLVIAYLHNASHLLKIYNLDGTFVKQLDLPAFVSIMELNGEQDDQEMFLSLTSFLEPTTTYHYDFNTATLKLYQKSELNFDTSKYQTTQVFYKSKDGTPVSMFLVHKKDLKLDGNNPALLYGYGGFNVNQTPAFSVSRLVWLENGGVYAVANLRGGNEYGEEWHQAGMLENKQNVFDDFIAAAEWLIANGYTNSSRLASNGGSNGGLLVSACMVQRPELFGAVVCAVPVTDMLRYHKFTVGRYWIPEYGNAETNPEHFDFLYAYSPLHNVKPGVAYPPTLITTADTDDRVVPLHSKKFAATLQEAHEGPNPILLRVETRAGHGAGKPTSKVIEEQTDIYSFLFSIFGMEVAV